MIKKVSLMLKFPLSSTVLVVWIEKALPNARVHKRSVLTVDPVSTLNTKNTAAQLQNFQLTGQPHNGKNFIFFGNKIKNFSQIT